jgi:single-stranded DNA-specific DHH superfamily exonuclease
MKTHLIYHRADADGILSAAIVCHALSLDDTNSVLWPTDYPEPCPLLDYRSTAGPKTINVAPADRIIIVDFSYPHDEMQALMFHENVTLYDHHEKAQQELGHLLEFLPHWIIDTKRAGCQIVWDELVGTPRPWFVDLVGWRDLGGPWKPKADPAQSAEAQALNTALFTYAPLDPYALAKFIMPANQHIFESWMEQAYQLSARQKSLAAAMAPFVEWLTLSDGQIPVLQNVHPALVSEVCSAIMKHTKHPIAAVVNRDIKHPYHHKWSLRSIQGGPNCNEIAKRFGGGGHPIAAGFSTVTLP